MRQKDLSKVSALGLRCVRTALLAIVGSMGLLTASCALETSDPAREGEPVRQTQQAADEETVCTVQWREYGSISCVITTCTGQSPSWNCST